MWALSLSWLMSSDTDVYSQISPRGSELFHSGNKMQICWGKRRTRTSVTSSPVCVSLFSWPHQVMIFITSTSDTAVLRWSWLERPLQVRDEMSLQVEPSVSASCSRMTEKRRLRSRSLQLRQFASVWNCEGWAGQKKAKLWIYVPASAVVTSCG